MRNMKWRVALVAVLAVFTVAVGISPRAALADGSVVTDYDALVAAVEKGGTVTLGKDIALNHTLEIPENVDVTLDLGGFTLSSPAICNVELVNSNDLYYPMLKNRGDLTVTNGTVHVIGANEGIYNEGTLEVSSSVTVDSTLMVYQSGRDFWKHGAYLIINNGGTVTTEGTLTSPANNGIVTFGGTVNVKAGKISAAGEEAAAIDVFNAGGSNEGVGAQVNISGGEIEAGVFAVSTNNTSSGGPNGCNVAITGGKLTSGASAIYWPSSGSLTIGAEGSAVGPDISSKRGSAIEICSGTLNMNSGTLSGGTELALKDSYPTDASLLELYRTHSGSLSAGDAITVISQRGSGYNDADLSVKVSGGAFNSSQNYAIRYIDCTFTNDGASTRADQVASISVSGGVFKGKLGDVDASYVKSENQRVVSGGAFSTPVNSGYMVSGLVNFKDDAVEGAPFSVKLKADAEKAAAATVEVGDGQVVYFGRASDAKDFAKEEGLSEGSIVVTTYLVTFKPGYESGKDTQQSIAKNEAVLKPNDPVRAGYNFTGWVSEDGKPYDFTAPVTGSVTLTGTWALATPEVVIDQSPKTPVVGDTVTLTAAIANKGEGITYAYEWYGNAGKLSGETGSSLSTAVEGIYYVVVTASDANGQAANAQSNSTWLYFDGQVMYRLYNPYSGEHLYTSETSERDMLDRIGWSFEGVGWVAPRSSDVAVYRLYNPYAPDGDHHYTTNLDEYRRLQVLGWKGEGVAWYSADAKAGVPIYRLFNPFEDSCTHHYTSNADEVKDLVPLGWKDEGIGWYALK